MKFKDLKWLTIWIFIITSMYHFFIARTVEPRAYLGLLMIIPLLIFLIQQIVICKKIEMQQFAIKKPKIAPLLLSIALPIVLGLFVHTYFFLTNQGTFLFAEHKELLILLVLGLTITTISALIEEIIWRGYYHNRLRKIYSFHKTAFIIALIWSLWHFPIALLYKGYTNLIIGIISYLVILFFTSYLLSYLREWSGSIIPATFFHGLMNVFYFTDGVQIPLSLHTIELTKCIILSLFFIVIYIWKRFLNYSCILENLKMD
ncbi:CPBP family intramembrane glutamic endopeptidase [Solibacillus sp. FSL K6-1554]|uniref:CPBP family intramembrane glutamic endopeptidase n=1 Tax=Solibacillus sp. FSL K6-1554 TaxID=2921472 RepID=UPI0030FB494F